VNGRLEPIVPGKEQLSCPGSEDTELEGDETCELYKYVA